jgi:hypothetical protein
LFSFIENTQALQQELEMKKKQGLVGLKLFAKTVNGPKFSVYCRAGAIQFD